MECVIIISIFHVFVTGLVIYIFFNVSKVLKQCE